ncbi:Fanconi anemia group D2 protein homolog isoform X4 [Solenopsis invicta]|uniref:Fanconi anemia group D2 protein homolog isoform X4 n=1 Tax=Solenopsis invicta TaxID=13686 RepID=UPI00193E79E2|nr:Fanconi anemia group D2 protein homolog isoform X4 [Solenopsis invicta]
MDKRRLMLRNNSLHKDLQSIHNQSSEEINFLGNKQLSSHSSSIITQEKTDSFHEEKLDIASSTLKPLNVYLKEKDASSGKGKKRNYCETENDVLEMDDVTTASKVLKKTLMSKQLGSQVPDASFRTSQQDIYLSRGGVSMRNKSSTGLIATQSKLLDVDNLEKSMERSVQKHKIANLNSEETLDDNDFDFSYNKHVTKKKGIKTTLDRSVKGVTQNRKQQDKEFQLSAKSERYKINKESEGRIINNKEHLPEKQNIYVPAIFSNFLQKCGITLSADDTYTLSFPSSITKRKMKKVLNSKEYQKKDVIDSIEEYIRDKKNFEKMLNDMETSADNNDFGVLSKVTLLRILLEIPEIQADMYNIIISKLNESVLLAFLLNDYVCSDIVKQMLLVLRNVELQPLAGDEAKDYYKNQVQIINTLKICMSLAKDVTDAAITVIKTINKNPKPLDLIILLLIFSGTIMQKNAESLLKQNIRCGFYRISLLHTLYNDYKEIVRELQLPILQLAGKLLKSEERVFTIFAIEWFRLQFLSQREMPFKQREIIKNIILLIGNNDQTVKHALTVLCKMAENATERDCLVLHCNHLRILLEKLDCFGLEEVGTLSDLLHGLCLADDSTSESLRDDLFILLQKQLSTAKPITKCKGVMGAVMAIKHLAGKAETCDQALKLFNKVIKSVKSCCKAQPLFYDQLAHIIAQTELINTGFVQKINNCIENEFINTYMIDKVQSSDDLVPNFGLNSVEDAQQNGIINFGNKRTGPIAPILFRLLKTCCMKLNEHEELDEIDALLGCEMLMPRNFDIPEPSTLDLIICGINWLREIILGFVTQTDPLLRGQVLKRLDTLIYLQGELNMLLTLCDTKYQPPPCYFHYFPLPPFIKIEKKISKKGKKPGKVNKMNTSVMIENESWEIGSTLCSKNPAYFRKFDAKIAYLLDVKIEEKLSQSKTQGISIKQVCFLVKELLATFENEPSEYYVKDLIHVLPKICSKLDDVVDRLRQDDNYDFRNGARLLLHLLTSIFNWKGFSSVTYNTLLREGLRNLARQVNEENTRLRSCKELVAESYKYFESLSDIATEISLATALVNICQALMKHSETYVQEYKGKHAKLAYGFLCLEWPNDKHTGPQYKLSIIQLLSNWLDNEPSPLDTVTSVLEWLPDDICNFESLLMRIPSVKRNIFHLLYKKLFDSLTKGINISLLTVNSDPERIKVWHNVASNVQKLVQICKTLKTKTIIQLFLQYMPPLIKQFLNTGMPILEHNLKYQTDDVTAILKMMQGGTRYLHAICCDCTEKKNLPMFKYVPTAKSTLEKLIYSVKGMLVLNDSAAAFWMGNLVNKNLDGREIFSQTSSDETGLPDINTNFQELANASSEILNSDLDENPVDETEDENDDIDDL